MGRIYCTCRDGKCYSFRSDNGNLIWNYHAGFPIVSEPLIYTSKFREIADRLYIVPQNGRISCLSLEDGAVLWKRDVGLDASARFISTPLLETDNSTFRLRNLIYIGSSHYNYPVFYCLDERLD
jgi:outer membrane protein assembly factor BamB